MQDLEQQLSLYRLLVEKSLGLMCIHDLNGVLLATNAAAARSLGYKVGEGPGRNLKDFLVPAVRPLFDEYLQRIRSNSIDSGLMRLLAKDGSERIWSYRNILYCEPGSPPCVLGHGLDVTQQVAAETALRDSQRELLQARDELALRVAERTAELRAEIEQRKRVEEELLQACKLESIGVLAGGIAHDFNNFLTVVQGNIALAQAEIKPGDPVSGILQQTASACRQATLLASQLLTFSKGGAPVRRVGSVSDALRDAVGLAQAGSRVAIQLWIAADLRAAEFDTGQIAQVLHNVLLNARQSMPEGGVVEVRAENAAAGPAALRGEGPYIRITVRDHGCGIAPEILPGVFDPYFTTKEFGSGLGLATAYGIVMKHEGHIGVESEPGVGTTITIYLPASGERPVEAKPVRETPHSGTGRILVMDDEEPIRILLATALARLGYEAVCAGDGAEAVRLYEEARASGHRFAAVILDLTVPGGMGGKEVAEHLTSLDPSARVILSSGYSDDSTIADFRKHGFTDVLLKPWTTAQLSDVLRG